MTDLDRKHFIIAQENYLICAFSAEFNFALTVTLWLNGIYANAYN